MESFTHQLTHWSQYTWSNEAIIALLSDVRNKQGLLTSKMEAIGFSLQDEIYLETLSLDVIKSSEIEGEFLETQQVRSSIARKLGIDIGGLVDSDRHVDGIVDMMMDATQHWKKSLNEERLFAWHSSLFPTNRSGMFTIKTGQWRVEAPNSELLNNEMSQFIDWVNTSNANDPVISAAIAHLWFITIHPFEDGNGRIARAITDMMLCRSENKTQRFYSMSSQIKEEGKGYYNILEFTQRGNLDITKWLIWFLESLKKALDSSYTLVQKIMAKHKFWSEHKSISFNKRQLKIIELLFGDFFKNLTTTKWAKVNKCSQDTALRDIKDLIQKNILEKSESGGRSTNYELVIKIDTNRE